MSSPDPISCPAGQPTQHPIEDRLQSAERELSAHREHTPLAVIEWDRQLRVVRWSGRAEQVFGWTAEEVRGKGCFEWPVVHEADRDAVRELLTEMVDRRGSPHNVVVIRNNTKSGAVIWCEWHNSVLLDESGHVASVLSLVLDITDRKVAEREREALDRQLLDAQKWESLGVLAGGVAHGFNNILTVILGGAGLAQRLLPPNSPAAPYLVQIEKAGRRAAELCRQMVAYAGRSQASNGRTDLNALIHDTERLVEITASAQTSTQFDLAATLPAIQADAAHVRQVLLNLVMNATEAVAEAGGEVVVRTRVAEAPADPDQRYYLIPPPGRYVELSVTDTGPGIADEVKVRMFDPFFTTKFPGRGLGLAAVLGIVRTHHGGILVDTAVGRGTTISIMWVAAPGAGLSGPVARPVERPAPATAAPEATSPSRLGVALVIDDEMYVREVVASTLEELGYEPLLAGDGMTGLEVYRQRGDTIRVAVIDVVMPGLSGDKVLEGLRALNPTLPVVIISGYTDRHVTVADGITEFLLKPFRHEDLAAAVQRVVESRAGGDQTS